MEAYEADFNGLKNQGFCLIRNCNDTYIEEFKEFIQRKGLTTTRDIVIGMEGDGTPLIAQEGDFWYHTDGVFMSTPPHFVLLQVLEASDGGDFYLLDSSTFLEAVPHIELMFGNDHFKRVYPVISQQDGQSIFRYRMDYMHPIESSSDGDNYNPGLITDLVSKAATQWSIYLGRLKSHEGILIDNWTYLHRRNKFTGRRVVRRIWIGD